MACLCRRGNSGVAGPGLGGGADPCRGPRLAPVKSSPCAAAYWAAAKRSSTFIERRTTPEQGPLGPKIRRVLHEPITPPWSCGSQSRSRRIDEVPWKAALLRLFTVCRTPVRHVMEPAETAERITARRDGTCLGRCRTPV
jgi:hypothetical protein